MAEGSQSIFVDISAQSLRFVSASGTTADLTIHHCGQIPVDSLAKGKLGEAAKKSMNPNGVVFASAAASIWTPAIVVRRITMPLMADKELKGAIGFEAEKHIPYPINECVLDYLILRKMQGSRQMELMLIVGKKDMINERRLAMEECGLALNFIDIHPFALANAFTSFVPQEGTGAAAVVHIGDVVNFSFAGTNVVTVLKGGQPQLVRDLGQETAAGLTAISKEAVQAVAEKIKSSVEFYENSAEEEIGDLYLAGQGAAAQETCDLIAQSTEKKIKPWGFADQIKYASKEVEATLKAKEREYLVCLGLAARGLKA